MQLGWRLFRHSFLMVWRNFVPALQIFLVPWLLGMAIVFGLAYATGFAPTAFTDAGELGAETVPPGLFPTVLVGLVVFFGVTIWTVVAWHRFVLLEEYPTGWLPPMRSDRMLAYLRRAIWLFMASLIFVIPFMFIAMAAMAQPVIGIVIIYLYAFACYTVILRWTITLPAAAIGTPLTLGEAWKATEGGFGAVVGIILCLFGLGIGIELVGLLLRAVPVLLSAWNIPTQIFVSILNVSIITTLYGYYVEKRQID